MRKIIGISNVTPEFEDQLWQNARDGRGYELKQKLQIPTEEGEWFITQIIRLGWLGLATLVVIANVENRSYAKDVLRVQIELDLRPNKRKGEFMV